MLLKLEGGTNFMSQIKGSALIEVFDAKTNKKLYEQKEDNIITHAYEKILQDYRGKLGYDMDEMFYGLPSIAHALFGGILLFGSVIPSDENHMLPTDEEMQSFVGCASYQGKVTGNQYAGEFSVEESEFTDDHAKFVYNFNTSEANGVINTICLTSSVGGYTGYKQAIQTEGATERSFIQPKKADSSYCMFNATEKDTSTFYEVVNGFNIAKEVQYSAVICDDTKSTYNIYGDINKAVDLQKETTRKILLSKVDQTVIPAIRITDIDALKASVVTPLPSLDVDKLYWVDTPDYSTYFGNTITLHYISISEPETTKTYNMTSAEASIKQYSGDGQYEYAKQCCIYNDKFYVYVYNASNKTQGRMYVINLDDSSDGSSDGSSDDSSDGSSDGSSNDCSFVYSDFTVTQLMMNGTDSPNALYELLFIRVNDTLYITRKDSDTNYAYHYFRVDPTTGAVNTESSTFVHKQSIQSDDFGKHGIFETYDNIYLVSPYSSSSGYSDRYLSGLYLPSGYLASINNLQSEINKTAKRTLKVTYTLTYE